MTVLTKGEDYWTKSQKFQSYAPADREMYVAVVIGPALHCETDPLKRKMLESIAARLPAAQTG